MQGIALMFFFVAYLSFIIIFVIGRFDYRFFSSVLKRKKKPCYIKYSPLTARIELTRILIMTSDQDSATTLQSSITLYK